MTTLGYVVIEYNQASRWPSVGSLDGLFNTEDEARHHAVICKEQIAKSGRGETYAIARVELVDE